MTNDAPTIEDETLVKEFSETEEPVYAEVNDQEPWWQFPGHDGSVERPLQAFDYVTTYRPIIEQERGKDGQLTGWDRLTLVVDGGSEVLLRGDGDVVEFPTGEIVLGHLHSIERRLRNTDITTAFVLLGELAGEAGEMVLFDPSAKTSTTAPLHGMHRMICSREADQVEVIRLTAH